MSITDFLGTLRMFAKPGPYQEKLKTIIESIEDGASREDVMARLGTGSFCLESVPTAIDAFLSHRDVKSAVIYAVSLGGDADTIGAMTGALAGACYGIDSIPSQWLQTVEHNDHLDALAKRLWEMNMGISRDSVDDVVGKSRTAVTTR